MEEAQHEGRYALLRRADQGLRDAQGEEQARQRLFVTEGECASRETVAREELGQRAAAAGAEETASVQAHLRALVRHEEGGRRGFHGGEEERRAELAGEEAI
eukprot:Hpha_TRINITY_DN31707_c0_g1::TRINITY_DN31707_c0_g1_i1::g.116302::m.116302